MDSVSSRKEARNQKLRARYAALSVEEKEKIRAKQRENYGRRVSRSAQVQSIVVPVITGPSFPRDHLGLTTTRDVDDLSMTSCSPSYGCYIGVSSNSVSATTHNISSDSTMPSEIQQNIYTRHRPVGRFARISNIPVVPWVLPDAPPCTHCDAFRFFREGPAFCCSNGQVCLPQSVVCKVLLFLFTDMSEMACEFRKRSRTYNGAFAFTSIGMVTDPDSWWAREGIYALKVIGQVYHFMNPIDGGPNAKELLQLFFLETVNDLDPAVVESKGLRTDIIGLLVEALSQNPYSVFFKRLRSWDDLSDAHIVLRSNPRMDQRTYNLPTVDEVAVVWRESDEIPAGYERDIRVYTHAGRGHKVNYYYGCYDSLQYPLLFPYGEQGWHAGIKKKYAATGSSSRKRTTPCDGVDSVDPRNASNAADVLLVEEEVLQANISTRNNVSCREFTCYRAQSRASDNSYLLHSGRLGHQFAIDSYLKLETSRLDFYRSEQYQAEIRIESYQGIVDSLCIDGENDPSNVGKKILLPSSFIGGPRDMRKRYVNAMALVQKFGKPDLFITMTCNPNWKEITNQLLPSEKPHDRPDLIARVFKAKLEELKDEIVRKKIFGEVAAYVYSVEYQKRGLPHVHWVIILSEPHKITSADVYDSIISTELPDSAHPFLRSYVVRHMMHGPCGSDNPNFVCMRDGACKNHYPKDFADRTEHRQGSYPCYKRRDDGKSVMVHNKRLDNRFVVPYNPYLLAKFDCHINVEICSDIKLVKYLYKYIYKGHDKTSYNVVGQSSSADTYDEILNYQDALCS